MVSFGGIVKIRDKENTVALNTSHIVFAESKKPVFSRENKTEVTMINGDRIEFSDKHEQILNAIERVYGKNDTFIINLNA